MNAPRTHSCRSQAIVLMVTALFALAPLATIAHANAHGHRFCETHLTIEDVDVGELGGAGHSVSEADRTQQPNVPSPADDSRSRHETCALLVEALPELHLPAPAPSWAPTSTPGEPLALAESDVLPTVSPLIVAPKCSPPAIAA